MSMSLSFLFDTGSPCHRLQFWKDTCSYSKTRSHSRNQLPLPGQVTPIGDSRPTVHTVMALTCVHSAAWRKLLASPCEPFSSLRNDGQLYEQAECIHRTLPLPKAWHFICIKTFIYFQESQYVNESLFKNYIGENTPFFPYLFTHLLKFDSKKIIVLSPLTKSDIPPYP